MMYLHFATSLSYLNGERVIKIELMETDLEGFDTHVSDLYITREMFEWLMEQHETTKP